MTVRCILCKEWFELIKFRKGILYCPQCRMCNKSTTQQVVNRGLSTGWRGMEAYRKQCKQTERNNE